MVGRSLAKAIQLYHSRQKVRESSDESHNRYVES